jgi:hypothetical protein
MGDVNFKDKIENNQGVIMGHAYNTATDGLRVIGSSTTVGIKIPCLSIRLRYSGDYMLI